MDNYTGKRLDGRYEIQEVIGVGGMAVVYKAYDNIDDRIVAVKILKEEYLANEEFRRRFKNESKAISVLSHPNIVKVYNVSYGDRLQYIVMEYVEGITLKEYIEQQGILGIKETVHFTIQILRALQHAHDKGIVHRDVKPQNIMLLSNGNIKVTDFGIARFSYSDTKTMTDSAIGSVHYISPEQARGDSTDDRADIYSVGVVMYEMLTGQLPFQSDNSVSVALMQLQTDPKQPRELNDAIPVGLEQIIMRAMRKNAGERYQSAAEMLLDIEEFKRNPAIRFQKDYFVDADPTKFVSEKTPIPAPAVPPARLSADYGYDDEEYDETSEGGTKSRGKLIAIGVSIGFLALALFAFVFLYLFTDVFKANELVVPSLVGKNYELDIKGNDEYKAFDIKVEFIPSSSSTLDSGLVFAQDPSGGQKLTGKNNVVTISVVETVKKKMVPDVYGLQFELAKSTLTSKGFKVNPTPTLSATEEYGTVLRTDPERNTEVEADAIITVYFASDEDLVVITNVIGQPIEMAKAMIQSMDLTVSPEIKRENSDRPEGEVIDQSPEEGEKVVPGSRVSLTVSTGVPKETTADLTLTLPASGGARGKFEVFVNNESVLDKTLLLDGSAYNFQLVGNDANAVVKVYIDAKEYYSCTVDFTQNPPVTSGGKYAIISPIVPRRAMPSVQGLALDAAKAQLNALGFNNVDVEYKTVYSEVDNGRVLSQSPSPSGGGLLGMTTTYPIDVEITLIVGQKVGI